MTSLSMKFFATVDAISELTGGLLEDKRELNSSRAFLDKSGLLPVLKAMKKAPGSSFEYGLRKHYNRVHIDTNIPMRGWEKWQSSMTLTIMISGRDRNIFVAGDNLVLDSRKHPSNTAERVYATAETSDQVIDFVIKKAKKEGLIPQDYAGVQPKKNNGLKPPRR